MLKYQENPYILDNSKSNLECDKVGERWSS